MSAVEQTAMIALQTNEYLLSELSLSCLTQASSAFTKNIITTNNTLIINDILIKKLLTIAYSFSKQLEKNMNNKLTISTNILYNIGHERTGSTTRLARCEWRIQCIHDLWVSIREGLGSIGSCFKKTTAGVEVVEVRQNTSFCRAAVARISNMFHCST